MTSPERLSTKTAVFAPLIDTSFGIVAEGCHAVDRRDQLGSFTANAENLGELEGVEAVIATGVIGFKAEHMDLLPDLKIICCFGVGFENVDLEAAKARGIAVTNAPATNGDTVADHAVGLALTVARGILETNAAARDGRWMAARKIYRPTLNGARVGIIGLGAIGEAIARRCAGFDAAIGYFGRNERPNCPYRYYSDVEAMAADSDFLIVACPGGPATHHIVNARVLEALGPSGILVNIGRGTVVDTPALANALKTGLIYGAGLDVVEGEPEIPADLADAPNTIITPHMAGRSPVALEAQCARALENIGRMSRGEPLVYQVV